MNGADSRSGHSQPALQHRETTDRVIRAFYGVYNELGYGFSELVYHNALVLALSSDGESHVEREPPVPVRFRETLVGLYKPDLVVDRAVIVELKSVESLARAHEQQVLNYLRATPIEVALLLNFGPKAEFRRFIFGNTRKSIRAVDPR